MDTIERIYRGYIWILQGLYWDNGKEMETIGISRGYIGIMERKMETIGIIQELYRDNGKENGNYRDYRDYVG